MAKTAAKSFIYKEEDYWLFPIIFSNTVFGAAAVYASVSTIRVPAIILFCLGLWFTSSKVGRSYSNTRARIHIAATVALSLLLALFIHLLTN